MGEKLTHGLLLRALEALEAGLHADGRDIKGRPVDRYLACVVRDLLGKQTVLDAKAAWSLGDRLYKAAIKVRADDADRDSAARASAHAEPYPPPGKPLLPWDEPATAPAAQQEAPPPPPPPPQEAVPPPPQEAEPPSRTVRLEVYVMPGGEDWRAELAESYDRGKATGFEAGRHAGRMEMLREREEEEEQEVVDAYTEGRQEAVAEVKDRYRSYSPEHFRWYMGTL